MLYKDAYEDEQCVNIKLAAVPKWKVGVTSKLNLILGLEYQRMCNILIKSVNIFS